MPAPARLLPATLLIAFLALAQESHTNAFTGVWLMNPAKSDLGGAAAPKSEQMTFQPDGALVLKIELAGGKILIISRPWSGGAEVPLTGAPQPSTMVSNVHSRTIEDAWKVGGQVLRTAHGELSRDGKTLTMTVDGKDDQGKPEHRVEVFEKQ